MAKAALIILRSIRPSLISHRRNPKKIELVIRADFRFCWGKQLSTSSRADVINDFLHCVKGASLSKEKIDRVRHLFKEIFYAEVGPIPLHWELRRDLITSFLLYAVAPSRYG